MGLVIIINFPIPTRVLTLIILPGFWRAHFEKPFSAILDLLHIRPLLFFADVETAVVLGSKLLGGSFDVPALHSPCCRGNSSSIEEGTFFMENLIWVPGFVGWILEFFLEVSLTGQTFSSGRVGFDLVWVCVRCALKTVGFCVYLVARSPAEAVAFAEICSTAFPV